MVMFLQQISKEKFFDNPLTDTPWSQNVSDLEVHKPYSY